MPDGIKAVFEYDENGVGKITLECMDMLMGQLIAYKRCIQSRSFWDGKHCDDCMFYDDCPFNPREDEDEPQTDLLITEYPQNGEVNLIGRDKTEAVVMAYDVYKELTEPHTEREGE